MSLVTDIILTCSVASGDDGEDLSSLGLNEVPRSLTVGDGKVMEARVLLSAFNWFDEGDFLKRLQAHKWDQPEAVRVFIKRQEDEHFWEWVRGTWSGPFIVRKDWTVSWDEAAKRAGIEGGAQP